MIWCRRKILNNALKKKILKYDKESMTFSNSSCDFPESRSSSRVPFSFLHSSTDNVALRTCRQMTHTILWVPQFYSLPSDSENTVMEISDF
ncbi:hypothetical protein SK128_007004 [Halocaridina rubra]|uniref:Uncharacterized protein n=1 Tax=Halocaridina rubra TaxID=373956 RepID=A0AAN8XBH7_HALRR